MKKGFSKSHLAIHWEAVSAAKWQQVILKMKNKRSYCQICIDVLSPEHNKLYIEDFSHFWWCSCLKKPCVFFKHSLKQTCWFLKIKKRHVNIYTHTHTLNKAFGTWPDAAMKLTDRTSNNDQHSYWTADGCRFSQCFQSQQHQHTFQIHSHPFYTPWSLICDRLLIQKSCFKIIIYFLFLSVFTKLGKSFRQVWNISVN